MGWNLDGEETPKPNKSVRLDSNDDSGTVGKVVDKRALRMAKYKAKVDEDSLSHRSNKPEEDWTTNDLVAEFYDLVAKHAPNVPGQVNASEVAKCINNVLTRRLFTLGSSKSYPNVL
jgi:hypothetical protein